MVAGRACTGKSTYAKYLAFAWATGLPGWSVRFRSVYVATADVMMEAWSTRAGFATAIARATVFVNSCENVLDQEQHLEAVADVIEGDLAAPDCCLILDGLDQVAVSKLRCLFAVVGREPSLLLLCRRYYVAELADSWYNVQYNLGPLQVG